MKIQRTQMYKDLSSNNTSKDPAKIIRCKRCVMDTTDPDIIFDENGICNHCKEAEKQLNNVLRKKEDFNVAEFVSKMKKNGRDKEYDCIVGLSGGVDSCYVIHLMKTMDVRPLAVHIDNGWNTELAVQNIKNLLERLDVDLYTYVLNWEEFRDLQLAFLKASTPDSEIPTDHMIRPILSMVADYYRVKYVIFGINSATESILPKSWSYGHNDWKYIKGIHDRFGTVPLKTFVYHTRMMSYFFREKQKWFYLLDYIDYSKDEAKKLLMEKYAWRDYGGKHYESFYTRFYQSYILPTKFGFDKRKMHLSNLIVSGQMSRAEAIQILNEPLYDDEQIKRDIEYFCEKMDIQKGEFQRIMALPIKTFNDYPSYENDIFGWLKRRMYTD